MLIAKSDLIEITENIWTTMLGLQLEPYMRDFPDAANDALVASIAIEGGWRGTVTLECSGDAGRMFASVIFGQENEVADHAVTDALGELVNMVGGNVKSLLPGPCQLSLPWVQLAPGDVSGNEGAVVGELVVHAGPDPVRIRLREAA